MGADNTPRRRDICLPGSPYFPENSIEAFREALRQGADALECDIHCSAHGTAMVIHGNTLSKYAVDLLSIANPSTDTLQVHKFTDEQLQQGFALKDYGQTVTFVDGYSIPFDTLSAQARASLPPESTRDILTAKKTLLAHNPDRYQIPTLTQLLQLAFYANQQRMEQGMPPLKLNIELKGKGSAVAAISAILQFYRSTRGSHHVVRPEEFIFLGTRDVGEICIANALLRGHKTPGRDTPDLGLTELKAEFAAKHHNLFEEEYHEAQQIRGMFAGTIGKYQLEELASHPMATLILVLAYLELGHNPASLAHGAPYFLDSILTEPVLPNFRQKCFELAGRSKPALKESAAEFGKHTCTVASHIATSLHLPGEQDAFIQSRVHATFLTTNPGKHIKQALREMLGYFCDTTRLAPEQVTTLATDMIFKHLGAAKTTLMLSTGGLFGSDNVSNDGNFNIVGNIHHITAEAEHLIAESLTKYGYSGFDCSLFDYCRSFCDSIYNACASISPPIDPRTLTMGFTASNWKASLLEDSATTLKITMARAHLIAQQLGIEIVLKVDEPHSFGMALWEILLTLEGRLADRPIFPNGTDITPPNSPLHGDPDPAQELQTLQRAQARLERYFKLANIEHPIPKPPRVPPPALPDSPSTYYTSCSTGAPLHAPSLSASY
jgi:hypothetical protein